MSAEQLPASPGMVGAVKSGHDELVLLIRNDGSRVTIADTTIVAWIRPDTGHCRQPHAAVGALCDHASSGVLAELVGGLPQIAVFVPDGWRGSFSPILNLARNEHRLAGRWHSAGARSAQGRLLGLGQ
jgi:hypothetical protein